MLLLGLLMSQGAYFFFVFFDLSFEFFSADVFLDFFIFLAFFACLAFSFFDFFFFGFLAFFPPFALGFSEDASNTDNRAFAASISIEARLSPTPVRRTMSADRALANFLADLKPAFASSFWVTGPTPLTSVTVTMLKPFPFEFAICFFGEFQI